MKRVEEELQNALKESKKREAEILALLDGSRAVLKYHEFISAARSIFDSCKNLIGATSGYIALLSKNGSENEVLFLDSGGLPCTVDPDLPMPIRGLRGVAYHKLKTVYHNDFYRSEWMKFMPEGHVKLSNVLFAPMVLDGKAVGLLGLANKIGGFTENDAHIASAFAELAAIALVQKRAEEALRRAHNELELRVKERTAELLKANEILENEIIERFRVEQALQESHNLLEGAFSNIHVLVAHLDTNFNFIRVNKAYAVADGRDPEFFLGKNHFDLYPNEENEIIFRGVVETGEPVFFFEKAFEYAGHPERGVTYWDWSLQPIKDTNGKIESLVLGLIDRTKRYRARENLIKSERKYRTLIEHASDGIVIVDKQLNFVDVNTMGCQMSGFSREELLSLNVSDLIPPDELIKNPVPLDEMFEGKTVREERRIKCKDGTFISVEVSAKMLDDGNIQAIVRDVTERKESENKDRVTSMLMELFAKRYSRKEYLDSVVQVIQEWCGCHCVGIRILNAEGYIPYESFVGFSREFMKLENILSLKRDICACIRIIAGDPEVQDTTVMTPNGSFFLNNAFKFINELTEKERARYRGNCVRSGFASIAIIPIRYREQTLGAIHLTDERERVFPLKSVQFIETMAPLIGEAIFRFNTEEALRKSEESLSEAQRIAQLGNWNWDIRTNELHWSDEIYRIFGLTPQQFGATYDAFLDSVHPEDREYVKKAVNEALYERKPYSIDHRIVLPDGKVRIVHEQGEVTFDSSGKPIRMLGTVQDITERKQVEEELRDSREQLRDLYSYLQSAREEERINIAREIHDELGQALTALKMDLSWLNNRLPKNEKVLHKKTKSSLEIINSTVKAVRRICAELRPEILDHLGLVPAIEWQVEEFKNRTGIKCDLKFQPEEVILHRDLSTTVFRILQEALTNITRHARATKVGVNLNKKDGLLVLKVADNGKGITKKQISNPKSFGLMGIRERVHYWGGEVKIKGARNKGTAVTISIPLREKGGR